MRIAIATCFHGRPFVTRLWCMHFEKMKAYCQGIGIELEAFAAITEGDSENIESAHLYGINYGTMSNEKLGLKWNRAIDGALALEPRGIVICGSDDLILNNYWSLIQAQHYLDFFGVTTAYVLNHDGRTAILDYGKPKIIGSGTYIRADDRLREMTFTKVEWINKTVHSRYDVVDEMPVTVAKYLEQNGNVKIVGPERVRIWPDDLYESFDLIRDIRMAEIGRLPAMFKTPTPTMICIKTDQSIRVWSEMMRGHWIQECPTDQVMSAMPDYALEYWNEHIKIEQ